MCRTERTPRATLSNRSQLSVCLALWHLYITAIHLFVQVTFTNEQEREGGEKTENKEELKKNWKENYVPYDDNKEEDGDNKKEAEKVAEEEEEDDDGEEEKDADEKDSYEKEVEGKEKLWMSISCECQCNRLAWFALKSFATYSWGVQTWQATC